MVSGCKIVTWTVWLANKDPSSHPATMIFVYKHVIKIWNKRLWAQCGADIAAHHWSRLCFDACWCLVQFLLLIPDTTSAKHSSEPDPDQNISGDKYFHKIPATISNNGCSHTTVQYSLPLCSTKQPANNASFPLLDETTEEVSECIIRAGVVTQLHKPATTASFTQT